MRILLEEKYNNLLKYFNINRQKEWNNINGIIKKALVAFLEKCQQPAIWCYGNHTKSLMSEFMFELKKVRYIVDNGIAVQAGKGFEIIHEEQIADKKIDGIIVSSWLYRKDIVQKLKDEYSDIKYLDIYEELEREGICLNVSCFIVGSPYYKYCTLNQLQSSLQDEEKTEIKEKLLRKIIEIYVDMKDFRSAIQYVNKLGEISDDVWVQNVLEKLAELYELQKNALKRIHEDNVLMLCIDGLRRREVCETYMRQLYDFLETNTYNCKNAYSLSVFTYESLIPAYSENDDLRTKYYEKNYIEEGKCRFIEEAKRQKRKIFFYTDGTDYIKDEEIKVTAYGQTACEKIWDFTLDAVDEKNGLFYVHILYESHYSYSNPYTREKLFAEGTNILFDFLEVNGGKMRVDYNQQQKDSLRYLDDTIIPLIKCLQCRMVLYADHGNILIGREEKIENIKGTKLTFGEELIQIPLAIKSPEIEVKADNSLRTLMELNTIIINLLNKKKILFGENKFVKVLRSQIYNLNFTYLYQKAGNERGLQAFEVFIFNEGYKLAVYTDGVTELYLTKSDTKIEKTEIKEMLLNMVRSKVTVCEL